MSPIEVRFTLSNRDVADAALYELGRSGLLRQQRVTFAVLGVVLLVGAAAGWLASVRGVQGVGGWLAFTALSAGFGTVLTMTAINLLTQQSITLLTRR